MSRRAVSPWIVLAVTTALACVEVLRDDVRPGVLVFAGALMVFAAGDIRRTVRDTGDTT